MFFFLHPSIKLQQQCQRVERDCVKQPFFFLSLPLMHTLHLLSSSLTTKFSSDISYQHFSSITDRNAFIIDRFNDWIIVYFNISQKKKEEKRKKYKGHMALVL